MNRAPPAEPLWTCPRDGPWPVVQTGGELERAETEWLHTNGAGAYAMSTVALMHTRRYHGMLVAALDPPLDRHVVLSHAEASVEAGGHTYRLATHQFPNVAPTPGYRLLQTFAQDPLPRWVYKLKRGTLERTLCLVRGQNAAVMSFTWQGRGAARLTVKPLMPLRPLHALMTEHGGMLQRATMRQGEVEIQPLPHLPPINFRHAGVFVGSPDWWRRFEYLSDRDVGIDFQEDMWTPGDFELVLEPGATTHLVVAVGRLPERDAEDLIEETRSALFREDPGPRARSSVRALSVAAEQFVAEACARPAIISGYPQYDVRLRDLLVALPGLLLARGRLEVAKRVLRTALDAQRGGLLPDRIPETPGERTQASPDATLWLFSVARDLALSAGTDDPFVQKELYPALRRAFVRVSRGPRRFVWLTPEGLIANGAPGLALTWMSAAVHDTAVTPRAGLAIELQALWSKGCEALALFAREVGDETTARAAEKACRAARTAFRARFWCNETEYPFDCLSEQGDTADAWADPSVRPNAVIALAIDPDLFENWQASAVIRRAKDELVTPRGLRSLSPGDRNFLAHYEGRLDERDSSFHQGTAWTWLVGSYVRAALRLGPDDFELREELRDLVEQALDPGPALGQVAQLADGETPFRARGCPAQAWSVAELLRALVSDLEL